MRVLVCGSEGCVGRATVNALRARGHSVITASRRGGAEPDSLHLDFMRPISPPTWADTLKRLGVEAVVNCVGILIPQSSQSFDRIHHLGPVELFRGAALAGVNCVVQISALGVSSEPQALSRPYLSTKLEADDALAALGLDWVVLRPSLIYGPGSQSGTLFASLSALPLIGLPGRGDQAVQPIHVFEVAEMIGRVLEDRSLRNRIYEVGGARTLTYQAMLQTYRSSMGCGPAIFLPIPLRLMRLGAACAEWWPQRILSRDTIDLLEQGSVPQPNAAPALLGRTPSSLEDGLRITPPSPWLKTRVELPPAVDTLGRLSLALMWLHTCVVSLVWPEASGFMRLLDLVGFQGQAGQAFGTVLCLFNAFLAWKVWVRPGPWGYLLQAAAVVGYTLGAAIVAPALLIDHCGPLIKNLPILGLIGLLWLGHGSPQTRSTTPDRRPGHLEQSRDPGVSRQSSAPRTF